MKHARKTNVLTIMLCIVLIAALALSFTACGSKDTPVQGLVTYQVITVDLEGNETVHEITSDKKTVGEELLSRELIAGEDGSYGLFIKTVNGITLDYDTDGMYWAFYINGEYAITGVDDTNAENGAVYTLKPES